MSRILCAVVSHALSRRREILRKTWVPSAEKHVDVRFFVGNENPDLPLEEGVINLHCNDTHEGIPDKVREICRWAIRHGYEFMWKCDDDVQLRPDKLVENLSAFRAVILPRAVYPKISGFLYGFDARGMEILSSSDIPLYENGWNCGYYQDEYWVADHLGKHGIPCSLIEDCGVLHHEFENSFPPYWVVAVHGENRERRSFRAFRQLNGIDPLIVTRRLGRNQ